MNRLLYRTLRLQTALATRPDDERRTLARSLDHLSPTQRRFLFRRLRQSQSNHPWAEEMVRLLAYMFEHWEEQELATKLALIPEFERLAHEDRWPENPLPRFPAINAAARAEADTTLSS